MGCPGKFVSVDVVVNFFRMRLFRFGTFISEDLFDGTLIGPLLAAGLGVILKSSMNFTYRAVAKLTLQYCWMTTHRALLACSRSNLFIVHKYELMGIMQFMRLILVLLFAVRKEFLVALRTQNGVRTHKVRVALSAQLLVLIGILGEECLKTH